MNYSKMTKAQLIEELKKQPDTYNTISNCNIETKIWDAQALESVNNISEALLNMTELFKNQKIEVTAIKISNDGLKTSDNEQ